MKRLLFVIVTCLLFGTSQAQTLYSAGKIEGGISTNAHITKVYKSYATPKLYVAGWFEDSLDVDPSTSTTMLYSTATGKSGFVAVYSETGVYDFSLCFTSSADSVIINDLFVDDGSGDIVICGTFNGIFNSNPMGAIINYACPGNHAGYMSRYNSTGGYVAGRYIGDVGGDAAITSIVQKGTNIVAGGWIKNAVYMDDDLTVQYTANTGEDAFLMENDDFLQYINSHQFEVGTGNERVTHLYTDGSYVFAAGTFTNAVDIDFSGSGTTILTSSGGKDLFYSKYDPGYNHVYGFQIGGAGNDIPRALAQSTLLLNFENTVDVNPLGAAINFSSAGLSDAALLRLDDATGQVNWAKKFGNAGKNDASFYYKDGYNFNYFGMSFTGTIDMDPGTATVNETQTNTPVNAAVIEVDDVTGEYRTHYKTEAKAINGFMPTNFNINEIVMFGEISGNNVDVMPYDSTTLLSHPTNTGLFKLYFDRCNMHSPQVYINGTFPCYTCQASLGASALGGVQPYSYYWSTDDSDPVLYNQCAGNYYVQMSDYHGCYANTVGIDISDHDGYDMSGAVASIPSTCGNDYGSASVVVTDNMGAYTLLWSNGDTTPIADSLEAGFYTVQITDTTRCYVIESFSIENTDGPSIAVTSSTNPNCSGANTGGVNITVTGGVTPYTFLWSNGATTEDLTGAAAGTYAVIVTDAAGCQNQLCIDLSAPEEMSVIQSSGVNSSCFFSNGSIAVMAFGGTEPYTYLWDAAAGAQTSDSAINLAAGMYNVTVTDNNGCTSNRIFGVSDNSGPNVSINFVGYPSCWYGSGYIDINVTSGSGAYNYLWSNGYTSEDAYGIYGDDYTVVTTDLVSGCKTTFNYFLYQFGPNAPYVCMVTVDSTGTHNVVVWDKDATPEADYYKIYREGFCSSSEFLPVGIVSQDSLSIFEDSVVNTETRSWRYYVIAVDSCGYESEPSTINKTIHLTSVYNDVANVVELNWEAYVGQVISQYKIYRNDPSDSTEYILIDSVGAFTLNYNDDDNLSAYTDFDIQYYVEAVPDEPCYASRAFNQNASRSNHTRLSFGILDTTAVNEVPAIENLVKLYPNPANDRLNIRVSAHDVNYKVTILNQVGQQLNSFDLKRTMSLSTAAWQPGIYYVMITNEQQQSKVYKLVIAH